MRVATASNILTSYDVRKEAAMSLAAGEPLSILQGITPADPHSPELKRDISAGCAALGEVRIDDHARQELNRQGLVLGAAGGAIIGGGIAVLMEQWRMVHPVSAVIAEAACAAIGMSLGALVESGQISMDVYLEKDGKIGVHVQSAKP